MNKDYVESLVSRVGKSTFIKYYYAFKKANLGNIDNQDVVSMMNEPFTDKSKNSRTSKGKRIFREGLEKDALESIVCSCRLDGQVILEAEKILREEKN